MPDAIATDNLTRRFGKTDAVNGLSLRVPAGAVFALIGPNGAGKTTTIKLLMNLLRPTRGAATVLGADSRHLGEAQLQRIGYVSENQRLPEWMTPAQLLAYCKPFYPAWDDSLAHALRERLRLTGDAPLSASSRGTKMKAALLTAVAYRPDVLILDEPFTGLDPLVRDELLAVLRDPPGGCAWSVLVSTHDIQEVETIVDWVGYIDCGRMVVSQPIGDLRARFPGRSLREIFVHLASGGSTTEDA